MGLSLVITGQAYFSKVIVGGGANEAMAPRYSYHGGPAGPLGLRRGGEGGAGPEPDRGGPARPGPGGGAPGGGRPAGGENPARIKGERAAGQYLWDIMVAGTAPFLDELKAIQAFVPVEPTLVLP